MSIRAADGNARLQYRTFRKGLQVYFTNLLAMRQLSLNSMFLLLLLNNHYYALTLQIGRKNRHPFLYIFYSQDALDVLKCYPLFIYIVLRKKILLLRIYICRF